MSEPKMPSNPEQDHKQPMARLLAIMARLRDPDTGCAWDVAQTFATIAPYTIEEAYEVADAIERNDITALRDELGDLLLQVVFHSRIAQEAGNFSFAYVATGICDKMERRHPHIFGDGESPGWEEIKAQERNAAQEQNVSALDGVAQALPALMRSVKLQKRAARVGFDWPDTKGVIAKIEEELAEVGDAVTYPHQEEEIGDLLFAVVNYARHLKVDPEKALRLANSKFEHRFILMEQLAAADGADFPSLDLDVMEDYWQQAKRAANAT